MPAAWLCRADESIAMLRLVPTAKSAITAAPALMLCANAVHEVRARGGVLYVLADADSRIESSEGLHVIRMQKV